MQHFKPIFACRFCDILLPLSSVQFRLEFATQRNYTGLAGKELTAAEELYNRWGWGSAGRVELLLLLWWWCWWKLVGGG